MEPTTLQSDLEKLVNETSAQVEKEWQEFKAAEDALSKSPLQVKYNAALDAWSTNARRLEALQQVLSSHLKSEKICR